MADVPNVGSVEAGGTNTPASGTYGEEAALDRLKSALPATPQPPTGPAGPSSMPPVKTPPVSTSGAPMGRPSGGPVPAGIPGAILEGPLPGGPGGPGLPPTGVSTPAQGRLLVLQQLSASPDVSEETRNWATMLLKVLVG